MSIHLLSPSMKKSSPSSSSSNRLIVQSSSSSQGRTVGLQQRVYSHERLQLVLSKMNAAKEERSRLDITVQAIYSSA